jgi:hypothetical protein
LGWNLPHNLAISTSQGCRAYFWTFPIKLTIHAICIYPFYRML